MAVPPGAKPVVKHTTLDDGFLEVARAIRQLAESPGSGTTRVRPFGDAEGTVTPAQPGPRSAQIGVQLKALIPFYLDEASLTLVWCNV
jgi:hypothetical protein